MLEALLAVHHSRVVDVEIGIEDDLPGRAQGQDDAERGRRDDVGMAERTRRLGVAVHRVPVVDRLGELADLLAADLVGRGRRVDPPDVFGVDAHAPKTTASPHHLERVARTRDDHAELISRAVECEGRCGRSGCDRCPGTPHGSVRGGDTALRVDGGADRGVREARDVLRTGEAAERKQRAECAVDEGGRAAGRVEQFAERGRRAVDRLVGRRTGSLGQRRPGRSSPERRVPVGVRARTRCRRGARDDVVRRPGSGRPCRAVECRVGTARIHGHAERRDT